MAGYPCNAGASMGCSEFQPFTTWGIIPTPGQQGGGTYSDCDSPHSLDHSGWYVWYNAESPPFSEGSGSVGEAHIYKVYDDRVEEITVPLGMNSGMTYTKWQVDWSCNPLSITAYIVDESGPA